MKTKIKFMNNAMSCTAPKKKTMKTTQNSNGAVLAPSTVRHISGECHDPDHDAINAERAEARGLRKAWIKADNENQNLRRWIREHGQQTDTCTYHILGKEICQHCQCGRAKDILSNAELSDSRPL